MDTTCFRPIGVVVARDLYPDGTWFWLQNDQVYVFWTASLFFLGTLLFYLFLIYMVVFPNVFLCSLTRFVFLSFLSGF